MALSRKKKNDTSLFMNLFFFLSQNSGRTGSFKYSQTQDTGARDAIMDKKSLTRGVVVLLCEYFPFSHLGIGGGQPAEK